MYAVDAGDAVRLAPEIPRPETGAPLPRLVADEHTARVTYYVREPRDTEVTVVFSGVYALFFGPPNEEALAGHPLAARGLTACGAFEVTDSSWVREMERRNRVHPHHRPERFDGLRHVVLTFHDSTLECVCEAVALEPSP